VADPISGQNSDPELVRRRHAAIRCGLRSESSATSHKCARPYACGMIDARRARPICVSPFGRMLTYASVNAYIDASIEECNLRNDAKRRH
jgi:hypothetical protein